MAKDRKITQENKDFYRLGYLNGEHRLKRTIEVLAKANHHLWEELTRLDLKEPRGGVLIDYKTFGQILKHVTKKERFCLVKKLKLKENRAKNRDEHNLLMGIT